MKKLSLFIAAIMLLSVMTNAANKHSKTTKYPSYKGWRWQDIRAGFACLKMA
jgi:hypothetical protein